MISKQYRAVVCGIARDEDRYLVEWVAYHLALGFDHIFIYDNMSVRPISDIISRRVQGIKVTIVRWPSIPGGNAQIEAYQHFMHTYRSATEWAAVIDIDEYINLKIDHNIHHFLKRFPLASGVAINWRIFGTSNHKKYTKAPMIERFIRASPIEFHPNIQVKTIYRVDKVASIEHHAGSYLEDAQIYTPDGRVTANSPFSPIQKSAFDVAQINHYFTKSEEEWIDKNKRGYSDHTRRTQQNFIDHNRNDEEDTSILVHKLLTYRLMAKIATDALFIPRPYNLVNHVKRFVKRQVTRLLK